MLNSYGPIVIFAVIAAAFPLVTLWVFKFIRPSFRATPEKVMPYECGITPESDARHRYTVRFYVVAILFIVFDVEAVFVYPWAVLLLPDAQGHAGLGWPGYVSMGIFVATLVAGLAYVWKKGALDWAD